MAKQLIMATSHQNLPRTYPEPTRHLFSTYETQHYKKGIIVTLIIFVRNFVASTTVTYLPMSIGFGAATFEDGL